MSLLNSCLNNKRLQIIKIHKLAEKLFSFIEVTIKVKKNFLFINDTKKRRYNSE